MSFIKNLQVTAAPFLMLLPISNLPLGKATWHTGCAAHAKKWCQHMADTGEWGHSQGSGYGENIYKSWGSGKAFMLKQNNWML